MEIYFGCTFKGSTKLVKRYLKDNNYKLTSKNIRNYRTIIVNPITKEYVFNMCSFYHNIYVFWLFKALSETKINLK